MNAVDVYYFSPVRGGPFHRLREAAGLVPDGGLGVARRIAALVAVAWLPVVIGALTAGQALAGQVDDPLFRHFAVHARLLLGVPLLILAEVGMERRIPALVRFFVTSGLVDAATMPRFRAALDAATRLRDSVVGSLFVLAVTIAVIATASTRSLHSDELSWAVANQTNGSFGFAGAWYIYVSRPIFAGLMAIWAWRLLVLWFLVWRLSQLDLRLVATHPDRVGGLGFLEGAAVASAPVVFAMSAVLASIWGHQVLYHGVHVDSLKPLAGVFVAGTVILFTGPLLVIGRALGAYRRQKMLEYSELVGRHGRLVDRKWIEKEDVGSPEILQAPELGPSVDIGAAFEAVARMRLAPIGKRSLLPIALAAALPLIPVFAIEVPLKDMLKSIAGAVL